MGLAPAVARSDRATGARDRPFGFGRTNIKFQHLTPNMDIAKAPWAAVMPRVAARSHVCVSGARPLPRPPDPRPPTALPRDRRVGRRAPGEPRIRVILQPRPGAPLSAPRWLRSSEAQCGPGDASASRRAAADFAEAEREWCAKFEDQVRASEAAGRRCRADVERLRAAAGPALERLERLGAFARLRSARLGGVWETRQHVA